jgi:hypothetical protein
MIQRCKVSFRFFLLFTSLIMSLPSSNSADLNQLISSLSVTRTNRARIREQGGQEEEGSNADGTSFRSHISVGTELPDLVNSIQGPPRSINVEVQEQSFPTGGMGRNRLKYKLVLVPSAPSEFSIICGRAIGQGHSICIVPNCSVSHQGDETSTMLKGELRVLKNPTSVFAEPRIQSDASRLAQGTCHPRFLGKKIPFIKLYCENY